MLLDPGRNLEGNTNYGIITDEMLEPLVEETGVEWYDGPGVGRLRHFQFEHAEGLFTVEAPPIGDPDGSLQEYDVLHTALELERLADDDDYRESVQELAWIHNWWLPDQMLYTWSDTVVQKREGWLMPDDGHHSWLWDWIPFNQFHGGHISADPDA